MATGRSVARELARTAWDAAVEEGSEEKTARSLARVVDALRASAKLRQVLLHPGLSASRKAALLDLVVKTEGQAGPLIESLIARRAVRLAGETRRALDALLAARADRAVVKVWSAAPLGRSETAALTATLARALGRPVRVHAATSRELIGGLRIQVGERIIDGSVKGAFDRLERHLASASVRPSSSSLKPSNKRSM